MFYLSWRLAFSFLISLMVSLEEEKALVLIKPNLCPTWEYFPNKSLRVFSPKFSFRIFTILDFTFSYMTFIKLFLCVAWGKSKDLLFPYVYPVFLVSYIVSSLCLCQDSNNYMCCWLFMEGILFSWTINMFLLSSTVPYCWFCRFIINYWKQVV